MNRKERYERLIELVQNRELCIKPILLSDVFKDFPECHSGDHMADAFRYGIGFFQACVGRVIIIPFYFKTQ